MFNGTALNGIAFNGIAFKYIYKTSTVPCENSKTVLLFQG